MTTSLSGLVPEQYTIAHALGYDTRLERLGNAKLFAEEGFGILPLKPNAKTPLSGSHGYKDASSDPEIIDTWFDENPDCNYGIVPPAGVFALDIDPRNDGDASFEALKAGIGTLPDTVTVLTGGGGSHLFFRLPAGAMPNSLPSKLAGFAGIDIKASNGYLVGPGSIHPNGTPYRFADGLGIEDISIATAPAALVALLTKKAGRQGNSGIALPNPLTAMVRGGDEKARADFTAIAAGCEWNRRFVDEPGAISEPEWAALSMVTAHCVDGRNVFHKLSKLDTARYDYMEADAKFDHVVEAGYKPPLCSTIHNGYGFDGCRRCPFFWTVNSPIALGYARPEVIGLQKAHVYTAASELHFNTATEPFTALSPKAFSDTHGHLGLEQPAHKLLMASSRTAKVHNIRYFPGTPELIVEQGGTKYLNTYRDTGCMPVQGPYDSIAEHFRMMVPDDDLRDHMIKCLANLVQHPEQKISHGWVIIGGQGIGKGFFTRISRELFGSSNVAEASARDLGGRFKGQLVDKQVLVLGEMMLGDRRGIYNESKELFSEDTVLVEEKYAAPRVAMTPRLIIGTSNHDRPIHLERDDRRFLVLKSPAVARDGRYYEQLYDHDVPAEAPAFKHMLLTLDLAGFRPKDRPPMTVAKDQVARESMSQLAQIFADAIEIKERGFEKDLVSLEALTLRFHNTLNGHGHRISRGDVQNALHDLGAQRFNDGKLISLGGGKKGRYWVVRDHEKWKQATLAEARQHLGEVEINGVAISAL